MKTYSMSKRFWTRLDTANTVSKPCPTDTARTLGHGAPLSIRGAVSLSKDTRCNRRVIVAQRSQDGRYDATAGKALPHPPLGNLPATVHP
jgi:hypothetical protein